MKQVNFLLEKHRRDVWVDASGDVWFFDSGKDEWKLLVCGVGEPVLLGKEMTEMFKPNSEYGPYTRLWKTPREDR